MKTPIYLDHNATTPMDPLVLSVWEKTARDYFGNPSSAGHAFGWAAAKIVEIAREHVADLIGASPGEMIFTSGATEANNLAILGLTAAAAGQGRDGLVCSNLEHPAVAMPMARVAASGQWRCDVVAAGANGLVEVAAVASAVDERTLLVSLIAAQNEIGTLQPLAAVGEVCRERGIYLHTDAAQAAGIISVDVERDHLDLVSLSAHKMYGPKGIGALYVRRRAPRVNLAPLMGGGGQEKNLRPGTLNVPAIAAFGEAARLAVKLREEEQGRLTRLRDRLWAGVAAGVEGVQINGHRTHRLPGNLNLSFPGLPAGRLLRALPVLAVSSGAACASGDGESSKILAAIGVDDALAAASLRIGLGRFTTTEEVDFAVTKIVAAVARLRTEV